MEQPESVIEAVQAEARMEQAAIEGTGAAVVAGQVAEVEATLEAHAEATEEQHEEILEEINEWQEFGSQLTASLTALQSTLATGLQSLQASNQAILTTLETLRQSTGTTPFNPPNPTPEPIAAVVVTETPAPPEESGVDDRPAVAEKRRRVRPI